MTSIQELNAQLATDVEITESFLQSALARGDTKAVHTWQQTLSAAKTAYAAVSAYLEALNN